MDILFFIFVAGLSIVVFKLKYGLTGKSYKFYVFFSISLIGPLCVFMLVKLIPNDRLRAFSWIPPIVFLVWIMFWVIRYLENNKR